MTLLEHGAMAADLVDIVRASTTEIVVVVCVVPLSVPSRVTLARPAPLRLLARASVSAGGTPAGVTPPSPSSCPYCGRL